MSQMPKPKLPKLNRCLLRRVKAYILAEPKRLYMPSYYRTAESAYWNDTARPSCGTAACIAGWTVILDTKRAPCEGTDFFWSARRKLGLSNAEAFELFTGDWALYNIKYKNASQLKKARMAAAKIDALLASR